MMRQQIVQRCKQCNGMLELKNRIGNIETFHCLDCGAEEVSHYSKSPEELYALRQETDEVIIDWGEKGPSVKDLMKLKHFVPSLKKDLVESIKILIKKNKSLSLGRYYPDQADKIKQQLTEAGYLCE